MYTMRTMNFCWETSSSFANLTLEEVVQIRCMVEESSLAANRMALRICDAKLWGTGAAWYNSVKVVKLHGKLRKRFASKAVNAASKIGLIVQPLLCLPMDQKRQTRWKKLIQKAVKRIMLFPYPPASVKCSDKPTMSKITANAKTIPTISKNAKSARFITFLDTSKFKICSMHVHLRT